MEDSGAAFFDPFDSEERRDPFKYSLPAAMELTKVFEEQDDLRSMMLSSSVGRMQQLPPVPGPCAVIKDTQAILQEMDLIPADGPSEWLKDPTKLRSYAPERPLRALSAYNFFFRDERERILKDGGPRDVSLSAEERLLQEHWTRDRSQKRRHRKTHGKIDFQTLSKSISARWKVLSGVEKEFYRRVAQRDLERYRGEMKEWHAGSSGG